MPRVACLVSERRLVTGRGMAERPVRVWEVAVLGSNLGGLGGLSTCRLRPENSLEGPAVVFEDAMAVGRRSLSSFCQTILT